MTRHGEKPFLISLERTHEPHDHGTIEIADFRGNLKSGAIGIKRAEHGDGLVTLQHHMRGENRGDVQNS